MLKNWITTLRSRKQESGIGYKELVFDKNLSLGTTSELPSGKDKYNVAGEASQTRLVKVSWRLFHSLANLVRTAGKEILKTR